MQQLIIEAVGSMLESYPELAVSPEILNAYGRIDRADYLPEVQRPYAYENRSLKIRDAHGQYFASYVSRTALELGLLHYLQLEPESGQKVAEIGTGAGELAAVMDNLGLEVHSIEYDEVLAGQTGERLKRLGHTAVHLYVGDGGSGIPEAAPYQRIVLTAGASKLSPILVNQLAEDGLMVYPVGRFFPEYNLVRAALAIVRRSGEVTFAPTIVYFVPFMTPEIGGWVRDPDSGVIIASHIYAAKQRLRSE